ncbi:MAG: hypothetical protein B7Z23_13155 [Pseudomonadales bacterium 32-61-5]|nr:MAG: hypothetical protein B7Z23_13155 [Pseudomonadales bacterium 32-61-5]
MAEVVTGDGCRIAYRFDGPEAAPVLLLSNSLGTDLLMWEPQIKAWTARFRVLRYDQRGHGASAAPVGAYSLDRLGRDVVELLDALDQGLAPLAQASVERWFTPEFVVEEAEAVASIVSTFEQTSAVGYAGCCAAIRDMDLRPVSGLIAPPTLVIGGLRDPSTPPPHSQALVAAIPHARLEMLDAAHLSNVEQPTRFADLVISHLGNDARRAAFEAA